MFFIDEEMTIHVTRGDIAFFTVAAEDDGKEYIFKNGDVVRFKAFSKKNCDDVVIQKDFLVESETTKVNIVLEKGDTKIKDIINKPTDYWYEVELNPLTAPQTIIGYDEEGARVLKLYPEGADFMEGDDITPEDIPYVDEELDINSARPIQNQAVAREFEALRKEYANTLKGYVKFTDIATKDKAGVVKVGGDSAGVKLTSDNMLVVASAGVSEIRAMASANRPITPYYLKYAVKEGLVQNDLEWTEDEKAKVRNLLGTGEGGEDGEGGAGAVELTQAEYDNLSEEDKMKDVIYFITDGVEDEEEEYLDFGTEVDIHNCHTTNWYTFPSDGYIRVISKASQVIAFKLLPNSMKTNIYVPLSTKDQGIITQVHRGMKFGFTDSSHCSMAEAIFMPFE